MQKKIQEFPYKISNILTFSLNDHNGNKVKYRLSRLTSSISEQLGKGNQFCSYINTDKKQSTIFDIEHVLAKNSWKSNDISSKEAYGFQDEDDFNRCVNRIGNLILFDTKKNKVYQINLLKKKYLVTREIIIPSGAHFVNPFMVIILILIKLTKYMAMDLSL